MRFSLSVHSSEVFATLTEKFAFQKKFRWPAYWRRMIGADRDVLDVGVEVVAWFLAAHDSAFRCDARA